jgi:hypothetical protein
MLQGIGLLDSVNERDVAPIAPLFLARPNLVVDGNIVLQKLKDRPDGMFLDRSVAPCPAIGVSRDGGLQGVSRQHGKLRRCEQHRRTRSGCAQQRGQQLEPAAAAEQQGVAVWQRQRQQDAATGAHLLAAASRHARAHADAGRVGQLLVPVCSGCRGVAATAAAAGASSGVRCVAFDA